MRSCAKQLVVILALLVPVVDRAEQAPTAPKQAPQAKPKHQPTGGELVFQNNCNRCHNAPMELRPGITGTVLRHMRVRANLSARDERMLLEYLAP